MRHSPDYLSELERGVLLAMTRHDAERDILFRQIETARVIDRDYTGVGLYTKLEVGENAPKLRTTNRLIEDYPKLSLEHPDLEIGAGVILWLADARIDTIEFFTYTGDWPKDESAFRIEQEAQHEMGTGRIGKGHTLHE